MAVGFQSFYRQLGHATHMAVWVTLGFFGLATASALLGLVDIVANFRECAFVMAMIFAALLAVLAIASLVRAAAGSLNQQQASGSLSSPASTNTLPHDSPSPNRGTQQHAQAPSLPLWLNRTVIALALALLATVISLLFPVIR